MRAGTSPLISATSDNKPDGGSVREVGMTAGVQFETRSFGIVHFYLLASGVAVAGGN